MAMLETMMSSPSQARMQEDPHELTPEDVITSELKCYQELNQEDWPASFDELVAWWNKCSFKE